MFLQTVTVVLLAFMLQTEALPTQNRDNSYVNKLVSKELDVFSVERLVSFVGENSDVIEQLLPSVASTIYKMATCKAETKAIVFPHIHNVMACINVTMNLYDTEIFLYHTFKFGQEIYSNVYGLGSEFLECHNETTNVFDLTECYLYNLEKYSSAVDTFLNNLSELVLEAEYDYYGLIGNVERCFGSTSSTTVYSAWHVINSQC